MNYKDENLYKALFGGIPYTFHRKEGFYPLILQSDEEAIENAVCNPGTIKVVNECSMKTVFVEC